MDDSNDFEADFRALNELVVNCPELTRLEELLGGFNLFSVLDLEYRELSHSNVLAWILNPKGSHGLGDSFLKRWLMQVVHEHRHLPLSAVDIECWPIAKVEVEREWRCRIDVLLIVSTADGKRHVVCIENKVRASQYEGQLQEYRRMVEAEFPDAQRIFLFLTKDYEEPQDAQFVATSYTLVHRALDQSAKARSLSIGAEPRVLLENYLRLLREKFMNESDVAQLAIKIYEQHKRAMEVIFAHIPANVIEAAISIYIDLLQRNSRRLKIVMHDCTGGYIRFLPNEWNTPENKHGKAWKQFGSVLFEISLDEDKKLPWFSVVIGKAPEVWVDRVENIGEAEGYARIEGHSTRGEWAAPWSEMMPISLRPENLSSPEVLARQIFKWTEQRLSSPEIKRMIAAIRAELPALDALYTSAGA